ncbi:MAG: DUF3035 domain-containing protein [Alphaproteobacteria bacterium]|nr:DUF3035 domain-containing protein [Alphaproteobacteria bacterium]
MTKNIVFMMVTLTGLAVLTSGCSSVDTALGRTKKAPDEFQVVVRPPLTLPPNFALRPGDEDDAVAPVSGTDAVSTSDKVLTRANRADASKFDALFGTDQRVANIREIVDEETLGVQIERRIPIQVLFGGTPNVGPNLNSVEEAIRIRRALASGLKLNETPTLATDPIEGTPLTVE